MPVKSERPNLPVTYTTSINYVVWHRCWILKRNSKANPTAMSSIDWLRNSVQFCPPLVLLAVQEVSIHTAFIKFVAQNGM